MIDLGERSMSNKFFIIDGSNGLPEFICGFKGLNEISGPNVEDPLIDVLLFYQKDKIVTRKQAQAICDLLNDWREDDQ